MAETEDGVEGEGNRGIGKEDGRSDLSGTGDRHRPSPARPSIEILGGAG